ncbi:Polyamine aminopropyltransferase [bacterium HR17]|uniref:Polyamine aminopropyltransferase n=1 Tax=Candidatus Fervidibacter japonicus TaxID=2035412 RepID=A0A2H5X9L8_9BACT|nr:Polyamine aminopropyltransferase [bacterium HR17]
MSDEFFTEEQTEGVHLRLRVRQWLLRRRTAYQDLVIAETTELGRLLALDGKVMLTEADEAFYHEMLVHPALISLDEPRTVAVIGGGDGGTVREVLRHPSVREVFWVEIDAEVMAACRQWLPSVHRGVFDDPRVRIVVAPGEEWLPRFSATFDAIIVDGTDPIGPALPLFEPPFFRTCQRSLTSHGILALQCGTPFYFRDEVRRVWDNLRQVFAEVRLYLGFVPTYPSGLWTYAMAGARLPALDATELSRRCQERQLSGCRYYAPHIHLASFALPPFVQELLA